MMPPLGNLRYDRNDQARERHEHEKSNVRWNSLRTGANNTCYQQQLTDKHRELNRLARLLDPDRPRVCFRTVLLLPDMHSCGPVLLDEYDLFHVPLFLLGCEPILPTEPA